MNLTLTVLEIVAPVFLLAFVGFAWVKAGFEYRTEFVTRLAMTLSLPCLIFTSLMQADLDPDLLGNFALATISAYAVVTVTMIGIVNLLGLDARTFLSPLTFSNTGNLGLPLTLLAFGAEGFSYGIVLFAVTSIWSFSYGVWVVSDDTSFTKIFREPLVGATALGALFLWQGWQTPPFLTNAMELIGQITIPLMLITLGVAVARLTPQHVTKAIALSVLKLIVCVAISWGIGLAFNLDRVAFGVLVIQLATPVAVTSYLLAEKYGADSQSVAGLVVVSTLLSVGTLPLLLAALL